jgi:Tfp pilus assembly protein PilO
MRAQRVWKVNGAASIGQLQSKLDDLNKRLNQLESQQPESSKVEELRSSALSLSREIDDIRCAEATEALSELLRK